MGNFRHHEGVGTVIIFTAARQQLPSFTKALLLSVQANNGAIDGAAKPWILLRTPILPTVHRQAFESMDPQYSLRGIFA